jgi:hypothetical protein
LNNFVTGAENTFTLRQEGGRSVFEQVITQGTRGGVDERTQEFVDTFFKPYSVSFSLTTPRPVSRAVPRGNVSGSQASISFPLPDVIKSPSPLVWRVEW